MAFMDSEVGVCLELKRCIWFKVSGRCYGPWNRRVTARRALQVGTCLKWTTNWTPKSSLHSSLNCGFRTKSSVKQIDGKGKQADCSGISWVLALYYADYGPFKDGACKHQSVKP